MKTTWLAVSLSLLASPLFAQSPYPPLSPPVGLSQTQKIEESANWLNANVAEVPLQNTTVALMPKSYDDNWQHYWSYLSNPNNQTQYNTYKLNHPQDATIERVMTHNGLDIYDGAVWSMALALATTKPVSGEHQYWYKQSISQYKHFLITGSSLGWSSYRAAYGTDQWTGAIDHNKPLCYNPNFKGTCGKNAFNIANSDNAYFMKFIAPSATGLHEPLSGNAQFNWMEYGAVSGEQAWAALIGPIQTAYLLNDGQHSDAWANDEWIDFAIQSLPALAMMQDSVSGGIYRNVVPNGVNPSMPGNEYYYSISTENNQSLFAGLTMLKQALVVRMKHDKGHALDNDTKAIKQVDDMQNKLRTFFMHAITTHTFNGKKHSYVSSQLNAKDRGANTEGHWETDTFALDVQTWGNSVFLSDAKLKKTLVKKYGKKIFFQLWQSAIELAGYRDAQGTLLGVGYTNQQPGDEHYQMSGEWTLGAINAAADLIQYYGASSNEGMAIKKDAESMHIGLDHTMITQCQDKYGNPTLGYLYANSRKYIPFGWFSNAMPATASTAWGMMVEAGYSPFILGGGTQARHGIANTIATQN